MVPRYGARGLWGVAWNWTRMVRISGSKMKEATANDFLKSGAGRRNRTTDDRFRERKVLSPNKI
jgi:hypothetical protein